MTLQAIQEWEDEQRLRKKKELIMLSEQIVDRLNSASFEKNVDNLQTTALEMAVLIDRMSVKSAKHVPFNHISIGQIIMLARTIIREYDDETTNSHDNKTSATQNVRNPLDKGFRRRKNDNVGDGMNNDNRGESVHEIKNKEMERRDKDEKDEKDICISVLEQNGLSGKLGMQEIVGQNEERLTGKGGGEMEESRDEERKIIEELKEEIEGHFPKEEEGELKQDPKEEEGELKQDPKEEKGKIEEESTEEGGEIKEGPTEEEGEIKEDKAGVEQKQESSDVFSELFRFWSKDGKQHAPVDDAEPGVKEGELDEEPRVEEGELDEEPREEQGEIKEESREDEGSITDTPRREEWAGCEDDVYDNLFGCTCLVPMPEEDGHYNIVQKFVSSADKTMYDFVALIQRQKNAKLVAGCKDDTPDSSSTLLICS